MSPAVLVDVAAAASTTTPSVPVTATLNDRLSFVSLTQDNVHILKSLNSQIFPVPYPDAYYAVVVKPELSRFCKLSKIMYHLL